LHLEMGVRFRLPLVSYVDIHAGRKGV
jgi:hypothetical protein